MSMKYRYLVIVRDDKANTPSTYFPSNSRNAAKHLEATNSEYCWVYDKEGWWLSYARRNHETGKACRPVMFRDGEARPRYAEMLAEFNRKEKKNA